MMKKKYFVAFLVLAGSFYSCEKTEPTRDKIEYSATREKAPTINKDSDVTTRPVPIEDTHIWKVEIEAANGIDSIYIHNYGEKPDTIAYGNGQMKYSREIKTYMEDANPREISIRVKDEIGLETTRKLTLIKGEHKSPFIIADFAFGGDDVEFLGKDHSRRPEFPLYLDAPDFASKNFAWAEAKVKSDISHEMNINIRYGSVGFAGQGEAKNPVALSDWEKSIEFGGTTAPAHEDGETYALRLNLCPYRPNQKTMLALDAPINRILIEDIVDKETRVIKIDVYVHTTATHPFASSSMDNTAGVPTYGLIAYSSTQEFHSKIGLGLANAEKYHDRASTDPLRVRGGQDHGMVATISTTDQWEVLTFLDDGNTSKTIAFDKTNIYSTGDVENNEVNMFILSVSPAGLKKTSSATYYFRNFRIEEVTL